MRLPSHWLSSNRDPAGSNRWITRRPPERDSTASFSRHVQALRELYERPRLHGAAGEQQ
jgi:hypothetical protein